MIGIFGGTFDPVHAGHLHAARVVQERLRIGDFRFLPAGHPPHRGRTHAPAAHRLAMLRLALEDWEGATIDERELEREGPSWMVDTLASLRVEHPDEPVVLIIGQDSANALDRWHRWRELFALAHIAVMSRPGEAPAYGAALAPEMASRTVQEAAALEAAPAGRVLQIEVRPLDVSSTEVRRRLAAGAPVAGLLPPGVEAYIRRHGLYGAAPALCLAPDVG